ncbi:MAG: alanine--tRNA ligase [Candidatus Pacebacteria bacterium]|nr:alanine--tRNA ligase [Candidatus Paceibacterota bacterium]
MNSSEIRTRFLKFFEKRGHKIIPSASLIPENDPSVLFNTAGMQPIVPYLLGQKHPMGDRLVDVQKCVRTGDIEEVGDNRHLTFFEMLGNWSLGDYFKEDTIKWSFEFLTNKEEGLGLDIKRIYVTVFEGNDDAPRDTEAVEIWKNYLPEERIYFLPAKNNWWSAGDNGPCGPDTEIFYDPNKNAIGNMSHNEFVKSDNEGQIVEIWNNVFMQYEKKDGKVVGMLAKHNVDTGMGLERITMISQSVKTVFDTDLFIPIINKIIELSSQRDERMERIIADHLRTAIFMIADGVLPSNTDRGYILRRLLRRSIRSGQSLTTNFKYEELVEIINKKYGDFYPEIKNNKNLIISELNKEFNKFRETLENGLKMINNLFKKEDNLDTFSLDGTILFDLYQSYGFPVELSLEEINRERINRGLLMMDNDLKETYLKNFFNKLREHQKLSQTSSAGMFKGGLANHNDKTIKLHTAHHLLLAGLQDVVSKDIKQRGSNITEERLRMDFMCDHKLTEEEKKNVEDWVNDKIKRNLNVVRREMPLAEAEKIGAQMEFGAKYPDMVSIYIVEDENGQAVSKEFCGGPHVENTKDLGHFKIQKEEAVAAGIRRIKAVLV